MTYVSRLLAWVFVVTMPLWFGSCKNNDSNGGDPVTPNSVEGSWKISGMKLSDGKTTQDYLALMKLYAGEDVVACLTDITFTLKGNGTVTGTDSPKCKSNGADEYNPVGKQATWKTAGNKLTITGEDGPSTYDYTVNGNVMTWSILEKDDIDGDGIEETYTTIVEFKRV